MGGGKSGFGDKQAQSEAKAEQKMRNAENSIRYSNTEHALIFDRNGNIIKQLDGDVEGYEMDEEAEQMFKSGQAYEMTHNHPDVYIDGVKIDGGTFSADDIADMVDFHRGRIRAVSREMTHVLRKVSMGESTNKGHSLFGGNSAKSTKKDSSSFASDYQRFMDKAKDRAGSITEKLILSGKLPYNVQAFTQHSMTLWTKMGSKWLENHAKDYGYEYHEYKR